MSLRVCLISNAVDYPEGGGHIWEYLNWGLGFCAAGCELFWLEMISANANPEEMRQMIAVLKSRIAAYGIPADCVAVCSRDKQALPKEAVEGCMDLDAVSGADLLVNLAYDVPSAVVERFRRTALIDVDPGLTQIWIASGEMNIAPHDVYFTTGETVGQPWARFPDCGVEWHFAPPAVFLPAWPITTAAAGAPYTTVSHWWGHWVVFDDEEYINSKRYGFRPYLDLPRCTKYPLELALCLSEDDTDERVMLLERGWRVRDASGVASSPRDYQHYVQQSRGEFSCPKPSCIHLQNAWIGDRTICYLASGKPAIIQNTGPSRFLPDWEGVFRFSCREEAIRALSEAEANYEFHGRAARKLAEEYFDAKKIACGVLERALA